MKKKDVAVIGVGYWGKNLARNYFELERLHTICDKNLHHLAYYQTKFSGVQFTNNFEDVLNNPEIKKVVLAIPTNLHFPLAKLALSAGKDVFVEKAMCESVDQAKELLQLAKSKQKILMVGHLLHYHPGVIKVKELVASKEIGDIYHCSFKRLNFGSIGAESSALWAFAPHDISVLFALAAEKALLDFQARHKSFFSEKYIDQSWLHFEFSQGLSADIQVGWSFPYAERKFTIMGTKGMIVFDDLQDQKNKVRIWKNQIDVQGSDIQFNPKEAQPIVIGDQEPLKEECKHFLSCCETRMEPLTSGEEGLRVMEILERAKSEFIDRQSV